MDVPCSTVTGMEWIRSNHEGRDGQGELCGWTPPCTTQRTQQSLSRSKLHPIQSDHSGRVSLACGARLVRDDSGTDVGFDESRSWLCLRRVERTVSQ